MNSKIDSKKAARIQCFALILIFAIALSFRIVGADWGLPRGDLHPDEVIVYSEAYQCALEHTLTPHIYYRPNHVLIKLNTLLYMGLQKFMFEPKGLTDFSANYTEHFTLFMTGSRVIMGLLGFLCVVFAYLIARFKDRKTALFAALLFAVFPSFIEHSHYLTPDIPLLLFLMGVLWAALHYVKKNSVWWLLLMALFTALATCEKYPGLYGCVFIAVAVIVTHFKKPVLIVRDGLVSVLALLAFVFAVSPTLITKFNLVLENVKGQNSPYHLGGDGLNFGETLVYYGKTAAVHVGLIMTICCIYGIVKAFKANWKYALLLLVLFIYILPISVLSVHWERYTLPIYAAMLLFGALGASYLFDDIGEAVKDKRALWVAAYLLIFAVPAGSLAAGAFATTGSFLAPDSRIALQDTLKSVNITADNTAYDCNTPLGPGGYYGAYLNYEGYDPAHYKYNGSPRFVMTSSGHRDLVLASKLDIYAPAAAFYKALDERYTLIALHPAETPKSYFLEPLNALYAARSVYRYLRGAMSGYEIRIYQLY